MVLVGPEIFRQRRDQKCLRTTVSEFCLDFYSLSFSLSCNNTRVRFSDSVTMLAAICSPLILFIGGCIGYHTGEVEVCPNVQIVEPGANISLVCHSYSDIHQYRWTANGMELDAALIQRKNDHSMKLNLNNVGVSHRFNRSTDVVCSNRDHSHAAACTVYVGYSPLAPKIECLMQNLDTMWCRWSNCDSRTKSHPEWHHYGKYVTTYSTTQYSDAQNVNGTCNKPGKPSKTCSSWCVVTKEKQLRYYGDIVVKVTVHTLMGKNSSTIIFNPHKHVLLSPPTLNVSVVDRGSGGQKLRVVAGFNSASDSHQFFSDYCSTGILLKIRYKEVFQNFNKRILPQYGEEEFWSDWGEYIIPDIHEEKISVLDDSNLVLANSTEAYMEHLPANSNFLLRATWKLTESALCFGPWSLATYMTYKTSDLKPPRFHQTSVLFFSQSMLFESFPSFHREPERTPAIVFWRHSYQSIPIHRNNSFGYRFTVSDRKYFRLYSAENASTFPYYLPISMHRDSSIRVACSNRLGSTFSPRYHLDKSEGNNTCTLEVVSMKLESVVSMRFAITWVSFSKNASVNCNDLENQNRLLVNLFTWQDRSEEYGSSAPRKILENYPAEAVPNTFVIEVKNAPVGQQSAVHGVDFRARHLIKKPPMSFSFSFRPHTAYRLAVSLSREHGDDVVQGRALLNTNIFYHLVQRPSETATNITCHKLSASSARVAWTDLPPTKRNGPIIGYEVYYTTKRECFSESNGVTCTSPYENCDKFDIGVKTYALKSVERNASRVDGWHVESDDSARELSIVLSGLLPGVNYYIGITSYNAAGTSRCFSHIISEPGPVTDVKAVYVTLVSVSVIALLGLTAIKFQKKLLHRICRRMPGPLVGISVGSECEEDLAYYCPEKVDLIDSGKYRDSRTPTSLNAEDMDKNTCEQKGARTDTNVDLIGTYVRNTLPPRSESDHEIDSVGSEIPSCSSFSNGDRNRLSSHYVHDASSESDSEIYTSTEFALLMIGRVDSPVETPPIREPTAQAGLFTESNQELTGLPL